MKELQDLIQTLNLKKRGKERKSLFQQKLESILPKSLLKKEKMPLPQRLGRIAKAKKRQEKKVQLEKESGMHINKKKQSRNFKSAGKNDGIYRIPSSLIKKSQRK